MPKTLTILLVEDHVDTREVISRFLSRRGHPFRAEGTCAGALQAFEQGQFKVLISNISLPDGDGCELARKLLTKRPQLYAVAETGHCTGPDVARCLEAGFRHHLCKPFTLDRLASVLDEALAESRAHRPDLC